MLGWGGGAWPTDERYWRMVADALAMQLIRSRERWAVHRHMSRRPNFH